MRDNAVILRCRSVVEEAGLADENITASNFLDYSGTVRDIIRDWPAKRRENTPWLKEFLVGLRRLRDDFLAIVEADPLCIYKPAHHVALEFHKSPALIRYFRGGNRISKTQAGCADNYWVMTGQHPYRPMSPLPASVGIVGVNFSKYCPKVFEPKYVHGEGGNPLSPVFPEGGKWFNHYDSRKHILTIACPACAEAGKAGSCKHPRSDVILFSDTEGPRVLMGGQYAQIQYDEEISSEFLGETLKRLETVLNSGLIVTETPLRGKGSWQNKILARDWRAKKRVPGTDRPLVSLHTISQFDAGLTPHERIRASMELMSPAEIEARVYGRPAAFSETGVFDSWELSNMQDEAYAPEIGALLLPGEDPLVKGRQSRDILFGLKAGTRPEFFKGRTKDDILRVWEKPDSASQYVIGADVAQGLTKGDASCAAVLKIINHGHDFHFEQVAQLHGWINPREYASELVKMALYYNEAILVPERRGPGDECIRSIKEWGYWNLFRDVTDPTQVEFQPDAGYGLDTNVRTKGMMIAVAQQTVKNQRTGVRGIKIYCEDTLDEMGCYGQEITPSGQSIRFRGDSGMHDDRVMAIVLAIYAVKAFPVYDYDKEIRSRQDAALENLSQHDREIWESVREQDKESETWSP